MACYHPITGYRVRGGQVKEMPWASRAGERTTVPCGQCYGCRLERSRQWAVRLMHEKQTHTKSCFVTLTYRPKNLPPRASLRTEDWQKFAHRLRKRLGRFRYFHCGEYGDTRGRPHLHALLYGISFEEDQVYLETTDQGDDLYTSPLLDHIWGQGDRNPIGAVTFKSAAYVARYIMKKQTGNKAKRHYGEVVDTATGEVVPYRKPEYITMSLKPGIGHDWINKYMDEVYPRDEVIVNGVACKPPLFYDRQYEKRNPAGFERLKLQRREEAHKNKSNNTPNRLAIRERIAIKGSLHFKRDKL